MALSRGYTKTSPNVMGCQQRGARRASPFRGGGKVGGEEGGGRCRAPCLVRLASYSATSRRPPPPSPPQSIFGMVFENMAAGDDSAARYVGIEQLARISLAPLWSANQTSFAFGRTGIASVDKQLEQYDKRAILLVMACFDVLASGVALMLALFFRREQRRRAEEMDAGVTTISDYSVVVRGGMKGGGGGGGGDGRSTSPPAAARWCVRG